MKNTIAILTLSSLLTVTACKKTENKSSEKLVANSLEFIDSLKVSDKKNHEKIPLSNILVISDHDLSQLLKIRLEKTTMMKQMKKYDQKCYKTLSKFQISKAENFYFDNKNLYFHYDTKDIAKDCELGDVIIAVSFDDVKGQLTSEFKERMKIK
ncbi:hypothetical protein [Chryseobacterium sp. 'Rf worker isolate 10']|uniref:hypothetical protein n=1 Tax=Chryseobacterium sp. 'Rf worker isolate 10' TaxID=2887348 RepID=UPI003D6FE852